MRIALLLGISGAGKQHISDNLRTPCQKLVVDLIRSEVLRSLPNEVAKRHEKLLAGAGRHQWPIWEKLISEFNIVPKLISAVQKLNPNLNGQLPLFAEGGLLAYPPFRERFLQALCGCDLPIDVKQLFWIHPSPKEVLTFRRKRAEEKKRPSDLSITESTVNGEWTWYARQVNEPECQKFSDAESALDAIDEFLSLK